MNTMHKKTIRKNWAAWMAALIASTTAYSQPTTLAEFNFNEGTGNITRSLTNDLTGSLGVPANPANIPESSTDTPSGAAGDRSVKLMGTGFLLVDDSSSPILAVSTEPLTLETWIKWDGTDPDRYNGILAYGGSYKLGLDNGQILWTLFGIVDVYSGHSLPPDGAWHHVAAAFEPGVGVTVYLDGSPLFVAETRAMRAFGNSRFSIGSEGLGNQVQASLDRVRVHKGLLGADQLDSVAATPKAPLATTLVAYNFNEATMPYQSSASTARPTVTSEAFNASNSGPVFSTDSPSGKAGDFSMEFASAGRRVIVPDTNTAIRLENGDFTIQAWVKFGPQTARSVLFFNNGPGGAVSFSILNRRVFVTTLGILDRDSTAAIPDDGGWHHIAVVHESGKEFRFYVDGVLGDTKAYTSNVLIDVRTQDTFYLGSEPNGGLPFVGKMDRVRVSKGIVEPKDLDFRAIPGVDPGAPELTIKPMVEVSWPSLPAGYVLQSTFNVEDARSWVTVTNTPLAADGTYRFYFPVTAQKTFYRLLKP